MIYRLDVRFMAGTLFKNASKDILDLADITGIPCLFSFNGAKILVKKGDSLISILNQYDRFIHDSSISKKEDIETE